MLRAGQPVKGLRQKLRTTLKQKGLVGKFKTDLRKHRGDDVLCVEHSDKNFDEQAIKQFEGFNVMFFKLKEPHVD